MEQHNIRLVVNPVGIECHLFIDGEEWTNVTGLRVDAVVGGVTRVQLDLINVKFEMEGKGPVEVVTFSHDPPEWKDDGSGPARGHGMGVLPVVDVTTIRDTYEQTRPCRPAQQ